VAAGLDRGLEEARLATCRHGRGPDGCLALAGDLADGCGATHIILGFALGFRGFQDGGGHTRNMDMEYHTLVMGALIPTHTPLIHLHLPAAYMRYRRRSELKMTWPRRGRRYQGWWGYPPQYPYAYPPGQIPPQQHPYPPYAYPPPMYPPATPPMPQSPEDELAALEDYKKELEDEKASIEQEISGVEARIKELKAMLEKGGVQPQGL